MTNIKYRVTFNNPSHTALTYDTLASAIRWGMAGRWDARNVWRVIDGKREAVVLDRYPTLLGRALGVTE